MKIIDDKKDYYDSVAYSMGEVDDHVLYLRNREEIKIRRENRFGFTINKSADEIEFPINSLSDSLFIIGFAGKTYIGAKWLVKHPTPLYPDQKVLHITYDRSEIEQRICGNKERYVMMFQRNEAELNDLYNKYQEVANDDLFHQLQCPIFVVGTYLIGTGTEWNHLNGVFRVMKNPILKDYEFYKVKDAFSAYQEVEQYIGGVLGNSEITSPPLSEKQAIQSKGFDPKYGFRTRPKNN